MGKRNTSKSSQKISPNPTKDYTELRNVKWENLLESLETKGRNELPRKKGACFVIMPFGGSFDDYYEFIFRSAIEQAGLICKRADDLYRPGTIVNDIWALTKSAKVILADLTGKNPNVFYELGIAHSLAKPAILVTDSIENVPFDLRSLRVLVYDKNNPNWGNDLRERITKAIREVQDAPLGSVLPTFLKIKRGTKAKVVTRGQKELLDLKRELDILKQQVEQQSPRDGTRVSGFVSLSDPDEALNRMIDLGLRTDQIVDQMRRRYGAPRGWTLERIAEAQSHRVIRKRKSDKTKRKSS